MPVTVLRRISSRHLKNKTMLLGALIFAVIWGLIALFLRRYPETMSGYNTMPKAKREKVDIQKLGRLISNVMFAGIP